MTLHSRHRQRIAMTCRSEDKTKGQEIYNIHLYNIYHCHMSEYRVIIAGGREFQNYGLVLDRIEYYLQNKLKSDTVIIVSGHATGADSLGERYANEHGLKCELYPADWNAHGKAAGPIRNAQMADNADALIAFWDGKSRGTKNMIETARNKGLRVAVVRY